MTEPPRHKQLEMLQAAPDEELPPLDIEPLRRHVWGGYASEPGSGPEGMTCADCKLLDRHTCLKAVELRTSGRFSDHPAIRKAQERRLRRNAGTINPGADACRHFKASA